MEHLRMDIRGMMCDHCERAVRNALVAVPGVKVRRVEIGAAELDYDPSAASEQQILDAVADEGYEASRV